MAKRKIKIVTEVLEENYLNKFTLVKVTETYEYSPRSASRTFAWGWSKKKDVSVRANFKNDELHGKDDYYVIYIPTTLEDIKAKLNNMLEHNELSYLERVTWVDKPSKKNDYGFSANDLFKMVKAHKKASPKRKIGYEELLTNCNFHSFCNLISLGDYTKCNEYIINYFSEAKARLSIEIKSMDKNFDLVDMNITKEDIVNAIQNIVGDKAKVMSINGSAFQGSITVCY